jgi:hypothetical protein
MKRSSPAPLAATLPTVAGTSLRRPDLSQNQALRPARFGADRTLDRGSAIGDRLIGMAGDFRGRQVRLQAAERSTHLCRESFTRRRSRYELIRPASGSNLGLDFGKNKPSRSRDIYKTKADAVQRIQQAVEDGANLIQPQGDLGLDKTAKSASGSGMATIPTPRCGHRAQRARSEPLGPVFLSNPEAIVNLHDTGNRFPQKPGNVLPRTN